MRSFNEIGRFENVSDDVNKAFQLYASVYLDYVDDNMQHFRNRDKDMQPLTDRGISWDMADESAVVDAYVSAATDILEATRAHDTSGSNLVKLFLEDYPTLRDFGVYSTNYAGSLRKGNVNYYFEINGPDAYIEKTFVVGGMRENEHYGHFTVEEARKCWKALKAKGFTEYIEPDFEQEDVFDVEDEMDEFMQRYGYDPAMEDFYGSMGVDYVYNPETGVYGPDASMFDAENELEFE